MLRLVGHVLGALAGRDLAVRCRAGLGHDNAVWAQRKRDLTSVPLRWAGSVTKASNDRWALARRAQADHVRGLQAGVAMLEAP